MPRNFQISTKSKEGKEFHRNFSKEKAKGKSKQLNQNIIPNQGPNTNYNFSNFRASNGQQQIQNMLLYSNEYPMMQPTQQMALVNRNQNRSASNVFPRSNQYQNQFRCSLQQPSYASSFNQNVFQFQNNFSSTTLNPICSPNFQEPIQNQMNRFSANYDTSISTTQSSRNLSPVSQKQKRQKFTPEEDDVIINLVGDNKFPNWKEIATHIKGRTGRQCRERYQHYLSPNLSCEPWTIQEDQIIYRLYKYYGSQWALIAQHFNGKRTNNSIKNRWNNHIRFFKDSLMNDEISQAPSPNVKRSFSNRTDTNFIESLNSQLSNANNFSMNNERSNGLISNNTSIDLLDNDEFNSNGFNDNENNSVDLQNLTSNLHTQQQGMTPLSTVPQTPEPQVPAYSFNFDNNDNNYWNVFDQKGSINCSSSTSALLSKIEIKENVDTKESTLNLEPNKIHGPMNRFSTSPREANQKNITTSIYSKESIEKEPSLFPSQNDEDKSKNFDDQFLCFANSGNPTDIEGIDFDFLMY